MLKFHQSGLVRRIPLAGFVLLAFLLAAAGPVRAQQYLGFSAGKALNSGANSDNFVDITPDVATDGDGNWVAVWSSTNWVAGTIGTDEDILVSRSTNRGSTWTNLAPLNSEAGSDSRSDGRPTIEADRDGDGVWIATWQAGFDIAYARSLDSGATWSPQALVGGAALAGSDYGPVIETDGADTWIVMWHSTDTLGDTVGSDNDIMFSRSDDDGATWSAPAALVSRAATDSESDEDPAFAGDGAGNWVAVWTVKGAFGTDADLLVSRSSDDGETWSDAIPLNLDAATDNEGDQRATIATDRAGVWVAAWVAGFPRGVRPTDLDIIFSRSTDNGATWSDAKPLNPHAYGDSATDDFPALACAGPGEWLATWVSAVPFGGRLGSDFDVVASRAIGPGEVWTHVVPVGTTAKTDSAADFSPALSYDESGGWVVVWSTIDTLNNTIGTDDDILSSNTAELRIRMGGPLTQ